MKYSKLTMALMMILTFAAAANADDRYRYHGEDTPNVEVWTNKGEGASYYYGEDVAVFFRADRDCYVVVYDVDPSGDVNVLFPNNLSGSSYVEADRIYRIPDYNDDFKMEVSGNSGTEHIFAVASYEYINPPDFMRYIGYDYGEDSYYDRDFFDISVSGDLDNFVTRVNARIVGGSYDARRPYSVEHTSFYVDSRYRHHRHYRYWDYDPYDVGSVWIGCDWPGAEIWIDGIFYGIAPILVPRVIVGYHWVWVYYGGYPCYQRYFYVPSYQRYYIDVHIDNHYKDYRYRRDHFRGWVFEEKRYRNEDGFRESAKDVRDRAVRPRSLPPTVIRDYTDKGVLSKDAPIAKRIRADVPDRDVRSRDNTQKPIIRDQIERDKYDNSVGNDVRAKEKVRDSDRSTRGNTDNQSRSDGKVIMPEKPRAPETMKPVERDGSSQGGSEYKPEKKSDSSQKSSGSEKVKSRSRESNDRGSTVDDKPIKSSKGKDSSRGSQKSEKSSTGKERRR